MMATLKLEWTGATAIETGLFEVKSCRPLLDRNIGRLVGGQDVVARYADPVWTMELEMGPVARSHTATLRSHVGESGTLTIDLRTERPTADYPNAEIWINAEMEATLTKARPSSVGDDIAQGDQWALTLQFLESAVTAL